MMIIALGGLQSIPDELYEAADMDGASSWLKFWNITMPLLKPVMVPAITLGVIWTFNNFNIVWLNYSLWEKIFLNCSCCFKIPFYFMFFKSLLEFE